MSNQNRQAKKPRLPDEQIERIRQRYLDGQTEKEIAKEEQININRIRAIVHNYAYPSPTYFLTPDKKVMKKWAKKLNDGGFTLVEILHVLYKMFGKAVAINTCRRMLDRTDSYKLNKRPYPNTEKETN